MGLFDSIIDGIGSFLPDFGSSSGAGGGFGDTFIGGLIKNPAFLSTALTTGANLFQGLGTLDQQKEALNRQREADKFKYLVDLAKIKYGSGGGGGGTLRNKNADLIEVLAAGQDDELKALESLSKNYVGALK